MFTWNLREATAIWKLTPPRIEDSRRKLAEAKAGVEPNWGRGGNGEGWALKNMEQNEPSTLLRSEDPKKKWVDFFWKTSFPWREDEIPWKEVLQWPFKRELQNYVFGTKFWRYNAKGALVGLPLQIGKLIRNLEDFGRWGETFYDYLIIMFRNWQVIYRWRYLNSTPFFLP